MFKKLSITVLGFFFDIAIVVGFYFAIFQHISWAENLIIFYTWFSFILGFFLLSEKIINEAIKKSLNTVFHVSFWITALTFYAPIIIMCIYTGWFFTATQWLIKWAFYNYLDTKFLEYRKNKNIIFICR